MKYGERARIFGRRLQQARKDAGLSRRDFAERIEISWRRLVAYELGTREPPLAILVNIARRLHVSLDWLIGLKEDS
ncbi:MAG: helix-turn-helix transcriptional regulator [Selenomonadaceae bacterium]|nr:helix-turn-helix transcriptional regulator [Selenomonadaceae bacterium]MBR1805907.1 helix-turn-helix transcriptional regulator [Selenomonadaceae bacterium]